MSLAHFLAIAAVSGAAVGAVGWLDQGASAAVAVLGLALLTVPSASGWRRTCASMLVFGAIGAAAGVERQRALAPSVATWFRDEARGAPTLTVRLSGVVVDDASPAVGGGVRLVVDVSRIEGDGGGVSVAGRVRLHVAGTLAHEHVARWTRGRRIQTTATLRWPAFIRNPGSPSIEWQALTRGYALAGTVKSAALIDVTQGPWRHEAAASVRRYVRTALRSVLVEDVTAGAVTTAILIGDRAGLEPEVEDRLIEAGTYHVLAISGGNIALITAAVLAVVSLTVRSARVAAAASAVVVAIYGWIVMGEPSVARAVTAALVWLLARVAGVEARSLHVLAAVTLCILAIDPLAVTNAGAWLSFGATLGILTLAEPCANALAWNKGGAPDRRPSLLVGALAASLAVQVMLIPVGAIVFARIAFAAPLLNLVAVPAMTLVQLAGSVAVVSADLVPAVGRGAAAVASWGTWALVSSPNLLGPANWWSWRVPPPPLWWVALFYATAIAAVLTNGWSRRRVVMLGTAALLVALLPAAATATTDGPPRGWLRVTVLDVGQGDATVVQFPSRRQLVIDGGNRTAGFDTGDRVVLPALLALGVRGVDWVAMSHADGDHAGGLPSLARAFRSREIWEGLPVPNDRARAELVGAAREIGAGWRELRLGDRFVVDGVSVEVLHPAVSDWERRRVRNEDSLVLRVRFGQLDLLLPGDIGRETEPSLAQTISAADRGAVRILKVPHHGSRTSTSDDLLRAFEPWIGIVSVGRNNVFGHPASDVLSRLEAAGAEVLRTDRDGATSIETDGKTVRVSVWSKRISLAAFAGAVPSP